MSADRRAEITAAFLNSILDSCRTDDDTVVVNPVEALQALSTAAATLLEADPTLKTTRKMREASEALGRAVLVQMRTMREHFDETGERPWDATPVSRH